MSEELLDQIFLFGLGETDAARDAGLYGRLHDGKRGLGEERKEESAETVSAEGAA